MMPLFFWLSFSSLPPSPSPPLVLAVTRQHVGGAVCYTRGGGAKRGVVSFCMHGVNSFFLTFLPNNDNGSSRDDNSGGRRSYKSIHDNCFRALLA